MMCGMRRLTTLHRVAVGLALAGLIAAGGDSIQPDFLPGSPSGSPPGSQAEPEVPAEIQGPSGGAARPHPTGPPAPAEQARPTILTVAAAGDLLVHEALTAQAAADAKAAGTGGHDFTKVLASVAPVLREADLAICHMEQPLAKPDGPFTGFPLFSAPPQLADAAAAVGFDTCSTASNHSLDTGMAGVTRTLENLERAGLAHAGTARSRQEARTPTIVDVRGVPVAHLSYTASFNGIPLPEGKPWAANRLDPDRIVAEARRARRAGAEIVIASLHWGTEYQVAADSGQLALARDLLAGPQIDLIVGHHVHVVQPVEKIGEKWVAYGMGNLITRFPDGSPEQTQDAIIPTFTFTATAPGKWQVTEVEVVATWMEYYPAARVVNLPVALSGRDLGAGRRGRYKVVFDRISGQVDRRGAVTDGLAMVKPKRRN